MQGRHQLLWQGSDRTFISQMQRLDCCNSLDGLLASAQTRWLCSSCLRWFWRASSQYDHRPCSHQARSHRPSHSPLANIAYICSMKNKHALTWNTQLAKMQLHNLKKHSKCTNHRWHYRAKYSTSNNNFAIPLLIIHPCRWSHQRYKPPQRYELLNVSRVWWYGADRVFIKTFLNEAFTEASECSLYTMMGSS